MKKRQAYQLLLFVLLFSFVTEIWIGRLLSISRMERLHENTVMKMEFRDQQRAAGRNLSAGKQVWLSAVSIYIYRKNVLRTKEDVGTEKGMERLSENQSGNLG